MPTTDPARPTPESFLDAARAEEATSRSGKLKIFLGASPGVGKTFAMLEEARIRARAGVDVVVALVETHGRAETAALLGALEQVPRRRIEYRGQVLEEMDLDALLARKPRLALIDEFAHTNAPGSRHPKRWQDVMEVLDSGIDVVTTLNIQHIESLNDAVAQITGIRVQETVPDAALDRADQIELIDLPPEELIQRLKDGKIYLHQQAGRALENFFTKGKLTALREMALRTAAGRVDAEMLDLKKAQADQTIWPTAERLLVCVNEAPVGKALVRTGKRMADRAKIPWIVATVLTPKHEAMDADARGVTQDALRLAETLGAETVTLRAESNAAGEILRFARERNVTRLVIGRPRWRNNLLQRLVGLIREPVSETLLDEATDFEITVVTPHVKIERRKALLRRSLIPSDWRGPVAAVLASTIVTLLAWPITQVDAIPAGAITVLYLLGVMLVAYRFGLASSLLASVTGFLGYNFFYTEPYLTLSVTKSSDIVSLTVFLMGALFTGTLASRLKAQVETMRAAQARTETLYDFARKIASATKADDVLWAAVAHVARVLHADVLILTPDRQGQLYQVQGWPAIDEELDARDLAAAQWAFERAEAAGFGTDTLPNAAWQFVPLATAGRPFGTMGVRFHDASRAKDPETKRLLLAVEDQVAVAVERNRLSEEVANARVTAESDKLRAALLNAVSHDLRTPLVTVIGATSSLADDSSSLTEEARRMLASSAHEEARRLDRTVQNLLDMTRLGHGALKPNRAAIDLREIIGRVRNDLGRVLNAHSLVIDIAPNLPPLDVDPVLIGQALANVLENATKYAPANSVIRVTARSEGPNATICIADEGPGIPAGDRDRVFDLFYRAAQGDGAPAGTGMGLAIVKGLVEAHGGSVCAEAGPQGRGTAIRLRLPLATLPPLERSGA
ncbi:MAG: sensor histidine kinase KdpD [Beijerinckiaceae bacterium]|nr:sensor histidine kinase KdpD [Beijerinckiaceae bacterium]MCZ8300424.1 sensor histidine kinase KdpD [Beijerinckiaceae bacterium]